MGQFIPRPSRSDRDRFRSSDPKNRFLRISPSSQYLYRLTTAWEDSYIFSSTFRLVLPPLRLRTHNPDKASIQRFPPVWGQDWGKSRSERFSCTTIGGLIPRVTGHCEGLRHISV